MKERMTKQKIIRVKLKKRKIQKIKRSKKKKKEKQYDFFIYNI